MTELITVGTAIALARGASELAKSIMDTNKDRKVRAATEELTRKMSEIVSALVAAQLAETAHLEEVRDLKAQIRQFEDWDDEKARYALVALGDSRALAYRVKPGSQHGEPAHCICTHCYSAGKKSILQPTLRGWGTPYLVCHACKAEILDGQVINTSGTVTIAR